MFGYLVTIEIIIAAVALIVSVRVMRNQQNKELDKSMNTTTTKHQILANPVLISYVLFPLAIVIGATILMYFYY